MSLSVAAVVSQIFRGAMLILLFVTVGIGAIFNPELNAGIPPAARQWLLQRVQEWTATLAARWEAAPPASGPAASPQLVGNRAPMLITSRPSGATVRLGTHVVGKTPIALKVSPGTYKVTLSRPGYAQVTRTIIVHQGKPASLGVTLVAATPSPAPVTREPRDTQITNDSGRNDPGQH